MKKNILYIFITISFAIIATPFILCVLRIKVEPKNKGEKAINLNFQRDFPLKSDLFKIYADIKTNLFDIDPIPQRVIDTKNGWKFLGDDFSDALSESKGLIVFSKEELHTIKNNLLQRKKFLDSLDITFFLAIAPNKHTVYDSLIPIKRSNRKTKFQQLDSLCKIIDVNFIDLGADFPNPKNQILYHKTDTHWNGYAGFYAYKSSIKSIAEQFKEYSFDIFSMDETVEKNLKNHQGDLSRMLMEDYHEKIIYLDPKEELKNTIQQKKRLSIPLTYQKDKSTYETRYQNLKGNNLKLLVFNDSFFGYYSKFLREHFNESVFIWNHIFDRSIIKSEAPDIFYHEILERDLEVLLYTPFFK